MLLLLLKCATFSSKPFLSSLIQGLLSSSLNLILDHLLESLNHRVLRVKRKLTGHRARPPFVRNTCFIERETETPHGGKLGLPCARLQGCLWWGPQASGILDSYPSLWTNATSSGSPHLVVRSLNLALSSDTTCDSVSPLGCDLSRDTLPKRISKPPAFIFHTMLYTFFIFIILKIPIFPVMLSSFREQGKISTFSSSISNG